MTTLLFCDSCGGSKPKEDLLYIIAYAKGKGTKRGQKAVLRKDICKDCFNKYFTMGDSAQLSLAVSSPQAVQNR